MENGSIPGLDPQETLYGYVPTEWVCTLFIVLFGLSTSIHIVQAAKVCTSDDASRIMLNVIYQYKLWWLYPTIVVGGVCEVLGWVGTMLIVLGHSHNFPCIEWPPMELI
jgi:hypothetical protein